MKCPVCGISRREGVHGLVIHLMMKHSSWHNVKYGRRAWTFQCACGKLIPNWMLLERHLISLSYRNIRVWKKHAVEAALTRGVS